jgi:hypothetical protein
VPPKKPHAPRKLLIAAVGVASINYVAIACGGAVTTPSDNTPPTATNPPPTSGNLITPPDPPPTSGNLAPPMEVDASDDADAAGDAGDGGEPGDGGDAG